jgi:hypothetical protein
LLNKTTARASSLRSYLGHFEFVWFTLKFLQLSPRARLGNHTPRVGYGDLERCMGTHAKDKDVWLDLYGFHDIENCAPTMKGKQRGTLCSSGPSTATVKRNAGNSFRSGHRRSSRAIKQIVDELNEIRALQQGGERDRRSHALKKNLIV